jgi:dTDP-4-dehydrorhamnose 3,5-epimerase-like enzyme
MKEIRTYSIDDVQVIDSRGPWQSKSGGQLNVHFALPREALEAFLDYDNPEFSIVESRSGHDIRGLRHYAVSDIPAGSIGGKEYHRARTEYVRAAAGSAIWQCVDIAGREREFQLDGTRGVIVPPYITHTYQALEDNTSLEVFCNTLFVPDEPLTHDTFMPPVRLPR